MIAVNALSSAAGAAHALNGEGWLQAGELGLALLLSAAIGLEREVRQKNAGLRTHTLVGVGAALFMLISKYGFTDVLEPRLVVLDPSQCLRRSSPVWDSWAQGSSLSGVTQCAASPPRRQYRSRLLSGRRPVPGCPCWLC